MSTIILRTKIIVHIRELGLNEGYIEVPNTEFIEETHSLLLNVETTGKTEK